MSLAISQYFLGVASQQKVAFLLVPLRVKSHEAGSYLMTLNVLLSIFRIATVRSVWLGVGKGEYSGLCSKRLQDRIYEGRKGLFPSLPSPVSHLSLNSRMKEGQMLATVVFSALHDGVYRFSDLYRHCIDSYGHVERL